MYRTLDYSSRDMLNFQFLKKGTGNSFFSTFYVWVFKKNVSYVIKFSRLIAFTFWDIVQYVLL